jgi:CRISPR/Cas system Type II protein with McrA/HNH and RuvC-like nuclease domain
VRHRVLITRRLVADIIKSYAASDAGKISRITIEVNRDLQAFSGKTNKEIEGELNQMLKDHSSVVKKLERDLADSKYRITAGLIRKARIAEDLDWTCPYSQKRYDAIELASGAYDKDHIIPRSLRPSDSMESLVITSKAINAMKGNRTAFQFMQEFESKDIEGERGIGKEKSNLTTLASFKKFVEKLSTKASHRQDANRKRTR